MAITFSDLYTESGLKSLDEFLSRKSYVLVYVVVLVKPGDSFPNVCKWYDAVSSQLATRFALSLYLSLSLSLSLSLLFI